MKSILTIVDLIITILPLLLTLRQKENEKDEYNRGLNYKGKEDFWCIKREYSRGHQKAPTKLPAELINKILMYSSKEGNLILDPFLGSGQIAEVSKILNRHYIGFEIMEECYSIAFMRLDKTSVK
ncbi:MAG: site-specific DNA-methyltransferase [Bacteroidia bacterium]|nr:site-specific DNA-methyltransferase [Bacteroidia bacterium]MDW8346635.1 site-specific DNA-methyltransferase [Bacteroidia bacterium]